jgi:heme exporter protein C
MCWRDKSLNKSRLGLVLTVVALSLVLVTTYLAIFFAPLPQTSVGVADEIASSIEGSRISVAGFVSEIHALMRGIGSGPSTAIFTISDFTDYDRFVVASEQGNLSEQWWTVKPLYVYILWQGWNEDQFPEKLLVGSNVSVEGKVRFDPPGIENPVNDYYLWTTSTGDVTFGLGPGQFNIESAPVAQKIFYFHMPSAWVSYLAFFMTLLGSAFFLKTRDMKYDRLASSSAELGVLFATIAIATGPIWAKQEWGVYWRWDDTKLVTTFILWLVYIGYLSLRAAMPEHGSKARVSAVYGILGFVTVPMSLLSSRIAPLLRSSHPQVIATSSGGLSPEAGMTIGIAVVAFTLLFAAMLIKRVEVAESEEELEELKRVAGGED